MCIVQHNYSKNKFNITEREDEFTYLKELDGHREGSVHKNSVSVYTLLECSGKCDVPCPFKSQSLTKED